MHLADHVLLHTPGRTTATTCTSLDLAGLPGGISSRTQLPRFVHWQLRVTVQHFNEIILHRELSLYRLSNEGEIQVS